MHGGQVNILSGAHGELSGVRQVERAFFEADRSSGCRRSSAPPSAAMATADLVDAMMPAERTVLMKIVSSIGHSRRTRLPRCEPSASCHTLVTNEGRSRRAAASAGGIRRLSRPIATVGRPRPTTPFTPPSEQKDQREAGRGRSHERHWGRVSRPRTPAHNIILAKIDFGKRERLTRSEIRVRLVLVLGGWLQYSPPDRSIVVGEGDSRFCTAGGRDNSEPTQLHDSHGTDPWPPAPPFSFGPPAQR